MFIPYTPRSELKGDRVKMVTKLGFLTSFRYVDERVIPRGMWVPKLLSLKNHA